MAEDKDQSSIKNGINVIIDISKEDNAHEQLSKLTHLDKPSVVLESLDEFQYSKHLKGYTPREKRAIINGFRDTAERFDLKWTKPHDFTPILAKSHLKTTYVNTDQFKDNPVKSSNNYDEVNNRVSQYYSSKVKVPANEWYLSTYITNTVLGEIEDKLQKLLEQDKNKGDQSRYPFLSVGKFQASGSSSDGLKAVKPNEFDVEIPVKIIGKDGSPILMAIGKQDNSADVPHGWFKMKLTEPLDIRSKQNERRVLVDKHDAQWLSTAGFKDTIMKSLIQRSINEIPLMKEIVKPGKEPWLIQPVLKRVSGPAITIDILLGKEVRNKLDEAKMQPMTRISVDLVPRLDLEKGKYDHKIQSSYQSPTTVNMREQAASLKETKTSSMLKGSTTFSKLPAQNPAGKARTTGNAVGRNRNANKVDKDTSKVTQQKQASPKNTNSTISNYAVNVSNKHQANTVGNTGRNNGQSGEITNSSSISVENNPGLGAVAKPCMSNTAQGLDIPDSAGLCQLFFRTSFSQYEKHLQNQIQEKLGPENCSQGVVQVMKSIHDRDVYRSPSSQFASLMSSYHVKTAIFHQTLHSLTNQNDPTEHWSPKNFTSRIADTCNFIDRAVDNRNLPHAMFCNPAAKQIDPVFEQLTTVNSPSTLNTFSRMTEPNAVHIREDINKAFKHQLGIDYKDLCSMGKDGEMAYKWATSSYDDKM